jgi:hypothetical protein
MYVKFLSSGSSRKPDGSNSARNARSQRIDHGLSQAAIHAHDDVGVGI